MKGAIFLFDFKINNGKLIICEAGCGFNSGVRTPDNRDIRVDTIQKMAEKGDPVYLDCSMLDGMQQMKTFFDLLKQSNLKTPIAKKINLDDDVLPQQGLVITCNPSSAEADLQTLAVCAKQSIPEALIFMMGNRTFYAATEDKVLLSHILHPSGAVGRPQEKLVFFDALTPETIDQLPFPDAQQIIIKPTHCSGAEGILVFQDKQKFKQTLQYILELRQQFQGMKPEMRQALHRFYSSWIKSKDKYESMSITVQPSEAHVEIFNPLAKNPMPLMENREHFLQNIIGQQEVLILGGMNSRTEIQVDFSDPNEKANFELFFDLLFDGNLAKKIQALNYSEEDVYGMLHWLFLDDPYALVQEYIRGDLIEHKEEFYEPTGRVVFFAHDSKTGPVFEIVDAFWKLAPEPLDGINAQSTTKSGISSYTDLDRGKLMTAATKDFVFSAIEEGVKANIFQDVLHTDLNLILIRMILSGDPATAAYAVDYIKKENLSLICLIPAVEELKIPNEQSLQQINALLIKHGINENYHLNADGTAIMLGTPAEEKSAQTLPQADPASVVQVNKNDSQEPSQATLLSERGLLRKKSQNAGPAKGEKPRKPSGNCSMM